MRPQFKGAMRAPFCTCMEGTQHRCCRVAGESEIPFAQCLVSSRPAPGGDEGGHSTWKSWPGEGGTAWSRCPEHMVQGRGSAGGGSLGLSFPFRRGCEANGIVKGYCPIALCGELLNRWGYQRQAHENLGEEFWEAAVCGFLLCGDTQRS